MHKTCIAFQDNLYKYKRKILSHGHLHPKLLQGQMEGVGRQDTSDTSEHALKFSKKTVKEANYHSFITN